jgi:hypothetical protein
MAYSEPLLTGALSEDDGLDPNLKGLLVGQGADEEVDPSSLDEETLKALQEAADVAYSNGEVTDAHVEAIRHEASESPATEAMEEAAPTLEEGEAEAHPSMPPDELAEHVAAEQDMPGLLAEDEGGEAAPAEEAPPDEGAAPDVEGAEQQAADLVDEIEANLKTLKDSEGENAKDVEKELKDYLDVAEGLAKEASKLDPEDEDDAQKLADLVSDLNEVRSDVAECMSELVEPVDEDEEADKGAEESDEDLEGGLEGYV